jgi:hypothetical protein
VSEVFHIEKKKKKNIVRMTKEETILGQEDETTFQGSKVGSLGG